MATLSANLFSAQSSPYLLYGIIQLLFFMLAVVATLSLAASAAAASYRSLGQFTLPNAAFVQVMDFATPQDTSAHPVLVGTSFGAFSSGATYVMDNIDSLWGSSAASSKSTQKVDGFKWPNVAIKVPESISSNALLVADGFLVPGKSTGGLYIVEGDNGNFASSKPIKISTDKSGWFYHNATFIDINDDGHIDVLTARANKGVFSSGGELLWLENPGTVGGAWTEHIIVQGPDVMFQVHEMDGNPDTIDLVATQFFSSKLCAYFFQKSDTSKGKYVEIDTELGAAYSIQIVDLNGDGKKELLVTTHENGPKSAVYAYEIPADVLNGTWTRHTLADASHFKVTEGGFNQDAPGFAYAFFPKIKSNSNKQPSILVAGDGSQSAYLMTPNGADFTYDIETIIKVSGVIGSIGIGDYNQDGYTDFFVPNYDKGVVYGYTFSPAAVQVL